MKLVHKLLIWASVLASGILLATALLILGMIALAPKLSDVDELFIIACVILKYGFPLGVVFAVPALVFAWILRRNIIKSIIALILGIIVIGAWWVVMNTPIGY